MGVKHIGRILEKLAIALLQGRFVLEFLADKFGLVSDLAAQQGDPSQGGGNRQHHAARQHEGTRLAVQ
jgi:hypothetical protein